MHSNKRRIAGVYLLTIACSSNDYSSYDQNAFFALNQASEFCREINWNVSQRNNLINEVLLDDQNGKLVNILEIVRLYPCAAVGVLFWAKQFFKILNAKKMSPLFRDR